MKKVYKHDERTFAILRILSDETDPDHFLSLPALMARLEETGIHSERKAIYRSVHALKTAGFDVRFVRRKPLSGYYLSRPFSPSEILLLRQLVSDSVSLSQKESETIRNKLDRLISPYEKELLPPSIDAEGKTDNTEVLATLEKTVRAIASRHLLEFRYYDLSITRRKQYRKNNRLYRLLPCAVVSNAGRLYAVFYSPKYQNFANYRLDKMSTVQESQEVCDPISFDAKRWIQRSFQMYTGEAATVTLDCDSSLISQIYDQFGTDLIISRVETDWFTVSIKTSLTPTLIAWILTFYDRITVRKPQELIDQLRRISDDINQRYPI